MVSEDEKRSLIYKWRRETRGVSFQRWSSGTRESSHLDTVSMFWLWEIPSLLRRTTGFPLSQCYLVNNVVLETWGTDIFIIYQITQCHVNASSVSGTDKTQQPLMQNNLQEVTWGFADPNTLWILKPVVVVLVAVVKVKDALRFFFFL